MQGGFSIFFLLSLLLFIQNAAQDTMTTLQVMKDGETIISSGGSFEMGFFSPHGSSNRYVGIWYKNVGVCTVVWVANRQVPLTRKSGILKLDTSIQGYLILVDAANANKTIWTPPLSSNTSRLARNPILQLLNSGNLVVRDGDDLATQNFLWQSFDFPTDTLLPGMKIGENFKTGFKTYLTSWKNRDDPAPGDYTYSLDPTGYPQLIIRNQSIDYYRVGSWNGYVFNGVTTTRLQDSVLFTPSFHFDENEVYFSYGLLNTSVLSRLIISPEGFGERWSWVNEKQGWRIYLSVPSDSCDTYSRCGAYGKCNVVCDCLDKFEPKDKGQWDLNDWSSGCVRRKALDCAAGDGFRKYSNIKLPDTTSSWYNTSMTLEECQDRCLKDCSCMAYATLDIKVEKGCLIWYGDLVDMKELPGSAQYLYVRVASSEADLMSPKSGFHEKRGVPLKVILPLLFGIVLLALSLIVCVQKMKKKQQQDTEGIREDLNRTDGIKTGTDGNLELPFFALSTVSNATENFSSKNKLGEGGFGPVYKGVLEEGQQIAVKRLSKNSTQGLQQFKNEVICIAKLQHRNLVKLLGYCVQEEEMMLIYEYMPNKSLDSLLFDETQSAMLDWPTRFHIINGIARGLLYLHQDSRLRVIHRDLKASNVLLDYEMNPKISDFGLAKIFRGGENGDKTRTVVGTYGYMSPEYAIHGHFSVKSDVFSFGVMVLELVCGKRNRGFIHQDHCDNLLGHAWRLYKEDKSLELIDTRLKGSCYLPEVLRSIQVGLLCVQQRPEHRPSMSYVVWMLGGDGALPQPTQPGYFSESPSAISPNSIGDFSITQVDGR